MKRCPECRRDYYDDSLLYCLDDGTALLEGPASDPGRNEPQTAILHDTSSAGEATARAEINSTDQTAMFPSGTTSKPKRALDKRLVATVLLIGLVALGGFFAYRYFRPAGGKQITSVAVLPFENRSGNPDTDYLSDGLAESLIYRLSQLPGLKVSPTNSVLRYKGTNADVATVAKELEVDAVMSGRLAQRGDDLTISVELTDANTRKLIWAEQYARKMSDLLATQREIATVVAQKLELKLSGSDATGINKKYTNSNEAYQSYLKGRFYWNKRTGENITKAIDQFQQAADADPNFALAYVGLADCYGLLEQYAGTPSSETLPKARVAAARALAIDDSLDEAHTSLGYIYNQSWQPLESEREFKRAIELNPNYATARHWYSLLLMALGRPDEAFAEIKRAQQADPLSPIISLNVGLHYFVRNDLDAAAAEYKKTLELDPNFPRGFTDLAIIYAKKGQQDEAIAYLQKAAEISGRANEPLGFLGYGYALFGKRAEAVAVLKELEARYALHQTPAMYPAAVCAGLGDKDRAFDWLEKDLKERTGMLTLITILPLYDTLRDDPRYTDLLRRMGYR